MLKKIIILILAIFIICIIIYIGALWMGLKEDIVKIKNYHPQLTTQIFDRKNHLIANIYDKEFRFYAKFDEIPPKMIEALLAVEDTLYFEHGGINYDAILRAIIKNIKNGKYVEGGSTLTQQLIKNMVLTRDKTLSRKIKEALLSIQIEHILTKEQILERYFNQTFFGHGYYGVKTAAMGYFKKPINRLSLKEIAMIVALPRAPSFYDPTKNLDFSLSRANNIISRMYNLGWISKEEYEKATTQIPQVYNQTLTQNVAPYVTDEVLKQLSYIPDIKSGGYKIKLSIDLDYQKIAQDALKYGYENIKKRLDKEHYKKAQEIPDEYDSLNGAMIVTDTKTGKILALVGGIDHAKSAFNRVTQTKRQFGSTIKPFIYQIAFDSGYSTATSVPDVARSFNKSYNTDITETDEKDEYWRPNNFSKSFKGLVTLKEALSHSLNLATINLVEMVGFNKVYTQLQEYGFKNLPKDMSIILGSFGISPLEAAKEYSIFSNYGQMVEPNMIESITDRNGNVEVFEPKEPQEITSPQQAFLTISILKEVVSNGTGRRAKVKGIEMAGKTGTTNNNIDGWFSGFTPSIQAIIWYGRDDNTPIGPKESGGIVSPPVFSYFISNVLKIDPGLKRKFDIPEGVAKKTINKSDYYYTHTSKLPDNKVQDTIDEKLLF
ncbi:PBP1A family penicillin-binding protein [Helicobacter sp. 13S00477-4]|uniref:transglycosylase domain-containing protein n=1 Tax=Helicobacter sp. 13S00477-4 TaxID=1905759 RepID=UPI000BA5F64B|nr:PBP1A family penicillin-binding protein [Helicobacter sp. 13S00477-4]PAF52156.1 penicillin-binding protein [Helicobacter sp. 13S00477-4]